MKKILLLTALASTLTMADFIGGEINLGYYSHTADGSAENGGDSIDIDKTLGLSSEEDMFFKVYLEHPIPVIPNFKVGYTNFSHKGKTESDRDFEWNNKSYKKGDNINSELDLKMYDITLYYEIIDMLWTNFDIGVNVKYIDGSISVNDEDKDNNEKEDFDVPIPMLYAKARFDIPSTDLSVQAEGNYVSYDGNMLYDLEVGARYTFALGFGIEAGYKTFKIKLDGDDDFSMDTEFSGGYGKVVWDF